MGQTLSQEIERREVAGKHPEAALLRKREGEMRRKYEEKKAKLYIDALNDECLPIICAVDTFSDFLFNVKRPTVPSTQDPFGIGNIMEKHLYGEYLEEFVALLGGVVEKLLAEGTPEVVEEELLHVVFANMSVLRIDFYLFCHNFDGMNTLFYFVQVGVIDMERVRLPVLVYELTRATKSSVLGKAGEEMIGIAQSSTQLHKALQILVDASKLRNTTGAWVVPFSTSSSSTATARQQMQSPPTGAGATT